MKRFIGSTRNSPTRQAVIAAILIILLNGLLYLPPIYQWLSADGVLWLNNLTNIAAALLSAWLGLRIWRSFQRGESLRTVWGSLAIGLVLWGLAEIIWDSYQMFLGIKLPENSPADVAWILGYLAMTAGLVMRLRSLKMRPTQPWQLAALTVFAILTIPVFIYFIIPILNDVQNGVDKLLDLFYPLADLTLALLALLLVLVLDGGLLSRPWVAIALGCFCIAVSDLFYTYALWRGIYQVNPAAGLDLLSSVIDLSYTFAYILTALGLYLQAGLQDAT